MKNPDRAQPVDLQRALAVVANGLGRVYTCAVVHVRRRGELICEAAFGRLFPGGPEATPRAVFDLASITKIAVGSALLGLVDRRTIAIDDPIVATIPAFAGRDARRAAVTYRHLLTHTSGLPPSVSARAEVDAAHVVARVCAAPLTRSPGEQVVYSDCGFILLGEAVARLSGVALPIALQTMLFDPLGIKDTGYKPQGDALERAVCTEHDAWRGRLLRGEVHDETCWSMGGIAGHAGLFGTADDVALIAEMYRRGGDRSGHRVLQRPTALSAVREQARSTDERRGFAWALKCGEGGMWGHALSVDSYGHTGYTGTSIAVDPVRGLTVVLLTNRVHVSRDQQPIAKVRAGVHDAVVEAVDAQ